MQQFLRNLKQEMKLQTVDNKVQTSNTQFLN